MDDGPLVSVGIPCYNRPEGLRRTLECICGQTYRNLEIIISDNCSPDPDVERVAREFACKDSRVSYFKQDMNEGPIRNFNFVLKKSCGKYFMWAADDDLWQRSFIERIMREFKEFPGYVAIITECRYFGDNVDYDFFAEGVEFYDFHSADELCRLKHMMKFNYGNLMYSIYPRDILFKEMESVFDVIENQSLNEIALFLFVVKKGNWRVIPEIGMYKRTNDSTYRQAKWEISGGRLKIDSFVNRVLSFKYHLLALFDIFSIIKKLDLRFAERLIFQMFTLYLFARHFILLSFGWKPKRINFYKKLNYFDIP